MAGTAEPTYRYFAHPRAPVVTTWRSEPDRCELCDRLLPGYAGSFYGERDCEFVCEECLLAGKLEAAGLSTNIPDVAALRDQLRETTEPERTRLIQERTRELEHRTPGLVTWQQWAWPACCGDYLRFEGEVGREELDRLAGEGGGWQWFLDHVSDELPVGFQASALPPRGSNSTEQWSLVAYHVRWICCHESVVLWDWDEPPPAEALAAVFSSGAIRWPVSPADRVVGSAVRAPPSGRPPAAADSWARTPRPVRVSVPRDP